MYTDILPIITGLVNQLLMQHFKLNRRVMRFHKGCHSWGLLSCRSLAEAKLL